MYATCTHWCSRRGCRGWKRIPKTFDLVKIRAKSIKLRAKSVEIWQKCVKTFAKALYVLALISQNLQKWPPKIKVPPFFSWRSCYYFVLFGEVRGNLGKGNFGKNGAWSALVWKNAPSMKRNAVVFFEVIFFSGKLGEIWAKILRTPKNLPAPTPMHVPYVSFEKEAALGLFHFGVRFLVDCNRWNVNGTP